MLDFQETMDAFLADPAARSWTPTSGGPVPAGETSARCDLRSRGRTSHPGPPSPAARGPWAGELVSIGRGREAVAIVTLDAAGDPVAEHHTLGGRRISAVDPRVARAAGPAVQRDGRDARRGRRAAAPGQAAGRPPRRPGPRVDPLRGRADRAGDPARRSTRSARTRSASRSTTAGQAGHAAGRGRGLRGRGRLRRPSRPSRPIAPAVRPRSARAPAGSRPSRSTASSGSSTARRSGRSSGSGRSSTGGIEGTLRVLPLGAAAPRRPTRAEAADRPDHPRQLHPPARRLGARPAGRRRRRDLPAPAGRAGDLRRRPARGVGRARAGSRSASVERHRVRVDADIVGPDGRIWMRRSGAGRTGGSTGRAAIATASASPTGRSSASRWRSRARTATRSPSGSSRRPTWAGRSGATCWSTSSSAPTSGPATSAARARRAGGRIRLWGRIAAKEAARRLWLDEGRAADLPGRPDRRARPAGPARAPIAARAGPRRPARRLDRHTRRRGRRAGVAGPAGAGRDRRRADRRAAGGVRGDGVLAGRAGLARPVGRRIGAEWVARLWCAKEAAAKATGLGFVDGPSGVEVVAADEGRVDVRLRGELAAACPIWRAGRLLFGRGVGADMFGRGRGSGARR